MQVVIPIFFSRHMNLSTYDYHRNYDLKTHIEPARQHLTSMESCNVTWSVFEGEIPAPLIHFFVSYCCAVCLIGVLFNVVAIWCVVGCPRTPPAIKVLLCALFSTTFLMCLLVMPYAAYYGISHLRCTKEVPLDLRKTMTSLYVTLSLMELLYITILAFFRAVAVWSSTKRQVSVRKAVALLLGTAIYSTVTTLLLLVSIWDDLLSEDASLAVGLAYNTINFLAPVVLTIACYLSMMLAVRRSKNRLAATPHSAVMTQVLDQATRAMLAVFISNLLFGLQHSIYHSLPYDPEIFSYVIVHTFFYMHLFVDPLAFVCFNLHHRQRVLHALKSCLQWVSCRSPPALPHSTSVLPLHVTPSNSSEQK